MRVRRRFRPRTDWSGWSRRLGTVLRAATLQQHRFALIATIVFTSAVIAGYLIAALVLFPAPIFATSRSVPRVIGMETVAAREALAGLGFTLVELDRITHPSVENGGVVWQDPPPGMVVPEGTEVRVTVSAGPQRIPVPDVAGYDAAIARTLLEAAGLAVGSVVHTQAPTPADVAVNTRPPAGATLLPGTAVTLVVSVGAATIHVPDLVGLTVDSARIDLEAAGLQLGTNFAQRSNVGEPGTIFYQDPAPGTLSAPGTTVNVRIVRSRQ